MAKKQKTTAASGTAPAAAVSAKADIDDIFAKPSAPISEPATIVEQTLKDTATGEASKGKRKKKSKTTAQTIGEDAQPTETVEPIPKQTSTKRKAADTAEPAPANSAAPAAEVAVFSDPSLKSTKKQKTTVSNKGKSREQLQQEDEEERAFRDSRGDGPRRKTEEGFFIFKEAELGIRPESGDTPLCPFDCDCCF
ncbi:hypothetical protein NliqN6_0263 [Naganishia liquefaciens]|uniref:DUF1764-domain-containing protein n=1 Tax=Naganishia liquefaciens TaxID=104408 RepID=A0A8H3YDJ8_9TREE|nr:hypothetical protein NliqN6_0263 [Naganishia liquefaciens]